MSYRSESSKLGPPGIWKSFTLYARLIKNLIVALRMVKREGSPLKLWPRLFGFEGFTEATSNFGAAAGDD